VTSACRCVGHACHGPRVLRVLLQQPTHLPHVVPYTQPPAQAGSTFPQSETLWLQSNMPSLSRFNAACVCLCVWWFINAQNPELDTFPKVVEGSLAKYLERVSPEQHAKGGTRKLLTVSVRCTALPPLWWTFSLKQPAALGNNGPPPAHPRTPRSTRHRLQQSSNCQTTATASTGNRTRGGARLFPPARS
jgi:hypothetical protein